MDPSGETLITPGLGVGGGFVVGGVVGGVMAVGSGLWKGDLTWGKVTGGITAGAVSGAVTAGLATADPSVIAVIGVGALAGGVGAAAGSIVEQGVDHGHVDPGKVVTDTVGGTIGGAVGAPVGHVLGKTLGNGTINIGGGMSVATVGGPSLPVGAITVSAGTVGGAVSVGSVVITSRSGAHLTNVFMAAKRMADEEAKEVDAQVRSRPSAKFEHDQYVQQVRPGAKEKTFYPGGRKKQGGLGSRRYDDFDSKTGTAYEGNTTPWAWITPKKLQEKLHQVGSDILLLKDRKSGVKKVIWFGTEPLPTTGPAAQLRIALEQAGIDYKVIIR